jgi:4-amino-4-deoxy-L-arabinose transferase-like glycosyltransferase
MTASRQSRKDDLVWLVVIVALGAMLRLWGLTTWIWEQDELYTLRDAEHLRVTVPGAPGIAGRPLYYLLQHLLLQVLPPTPGFLRSPAFLFGLLGIVATWWLGRRIFGDRAGLVAAALVAISPWHLYASQFARYWTLVYLFAAVLYGMLPRALEDSSPRRLLAVLAVLVLGTLTHPTFLFATAGVILALHLMSPDGQWGLRWPGARPWLYLWGPYLAFLVVGYVALKLNGHGEAIRNAEGRGVLASLRLVPAMIQWTPLEVAGASAVAGGFLWFGDQSRDRRWTLMAVAGASVAFLLLFVSSLSTGVYADYGIGCLPLVLVTVGGAVQRIAEAVPGRMSGWVTGGATAVLAIGSAPGTLSHLSDGSRFDYRPAYAAIARLAPDRPVAGLIDVLREAYAPEIKPLRYSGSRPSRDLTGFWGIATYQRYGLRARNPQGQQIIDANCHRVLITERPRIDYRIYRVELYWCGTDPVPGSEAGRDGQ